MIGLLHPQVTSHEVTAGKCPSGTIWSPAYSHGFVETSFRRPICRCGVPRGCPLQDEGAPSEKLVLTLTSAGGTEAIPLRSVGSVSGPHSGPSCLVCALEPEASLYVRVRVCLLRH